LLTISLLSGGSNHTGTLMLLLDEPIS
jgi:hypothetical protein